MAPGINIRVTYTQIFIVYTDSKIHTFVNCFKNLKLALVRINMERIFPSDDHENEKIREIFKFPVPLIQRRL